MKPNASEDAHKRREAILILIHNNPMSSVQIAHKLDFDRAVVSNDISCLKRIGLVEVKGKTMTKTSQGHGRAVELVSCKQMYSADELKALSSSKTEAKAIPDLPSDILMMMGYTKLKPENAKVVHNEGFHTPTKSKRIQVNIPSQFGMFDMATGAW